MNDGDYVSVKEAAAIFAVDQSTVHRWIHTGWLKADVVPYRRRNRYRIPASEIERLKRGE